jgi:hypothetical protein
MLSLLLSVSMSSIFGPRLSAGQRAVATCGRLQRHATEAILYARAGSDGTIKLAKHLEWQ